MHLSTICFSSKKYLDTTILGEHTFSSPVVLKLWGACKLPMPKHTPYHTKFTRTSETQMTVFKIPHD